MRIKQCQQRLGLSARALDQRRVALHHRCANQLHERIAAGGIQRGLLPVHPAFGIEACGEIKRIKAARRVFRAEVAHDDVGLPQHKAVVVNHRHEAIRIHRGVPRLIDEAERGARIGALESDASFARRPDDLADIDRGQPTPDLQHRISARINSASVRTPRSIAGGGTVTNDSRNVLRAGAPA